MNFLKLQFFFNLQTEYFEMDMPEFLDFLYDGVDFETYEQKRLEFSHENGLFESDLPSYSEWLAHHDRNFIVSKKCADCGENFLQEVPHKRKRRSEEKYCDCNLRVRISNARK